MCLFSVPLCLAAVCSTTESQHLNRQHGCVTSGPPHHCAVSRPVPPTARLFALGFFPSPSLSPASPAPISASASFLSHSSSSPRSWAFVSHSVISGMSKERHCQSSGSLYELAADLPIRWLCCIHGVCLCCRLVGNTSLVSNQPMSKHAYSMIS